VALCTVVLVNIAALGLALGLTSRIRARTALRTVFVLPMVVSGIIIAFVFQFVFSNTLPTAGQALGIGALEESILADPNLAWIAVVLVTAWVLLAAVWGVQLSVALTALGVTSLVVSLALQDTLANLSEPVLRHIVYRVATAPSVLLVGTGTAAPLCQMLSYRLASIGVAVAWTSDPMMMLAHVSRLRPGDLILGISYSGRSRDTVQALQYAKGHGVETVGLTANPQSPLGDVVGLVDAASSAASPTGRCAGVMSIRYRMVNVRNRMEEVR
jgi:hypothetical protein